MNRVSKGLLPRGLLLLAGLTAWSAPRFAFEPQPDLVILNVPAPLLRRYSRDFRCDRPEPQRREPRSRSKAFTDNLSFTKYKRNGGFVLSYAGLDPSDPAQRGYRLFIGDISFPDVLSKGQVQFLCTDQPSTSVLPQPTRINHYN